jgi:SAM domain (Sterile alpha motif)
LALCAPPATDQLYAFREGYLGVSSWEGAPLRDTETARDLSRQRNYNRRRGGCRFLAEDHRMDIAGWLQDLGLQRYVQAFRDNDIDAEVLLKLTIEDLISIGVTSVGHRREPGMMLATR